jgi:flagellar biogenesis protein FliO
MNSESKRYAPGASVVAAFDDVQVAVISGKLIYILYFLLIIFFVFFF